MNRNDLYLGFQFVDDEILARSERTAPKKKWGTWLGMAACFCLIAAFTAVSVFSSFGAMTVTAYAYGTEQELTAAGASFTTGAIKDNGDLTGHPLLFHLAGSDIDKVRFSCKNGQLNFIDLTEQRSEYGFAQNFTVSYGEDKSEYSSLLIDWVPTNITEALRGEDMTIADLPEDMRHDAIVMEITFAKGNTQTQIINISLEDDGTIRAAFDNYTISDSDRFVFRADSAPIPRDTLYTQGEMTVTFYDENGNEVLPDANWYAAKDIAAIAVQWNGRSPDMVQMLFTPAGTETAEQMGFLETESVNAENKVILSAASLHRDNLMGHLQIVINFGSSTIQSERYNVIYDPDA